ncbi:hypothetical protein LMG28614_06499 [Paraburkholderia ultramafica]|uniref:DUF485 domain-containing protein n=1 Tax=Paraburkholderia ultramafica TaxID=1544867 RepID=A0A6S7CDI7_9BURK|nr:DUF485 domain-containing protein [Paraburkholderia ultramafica]CAB3806962.1 hypothetical protein LMG28614_06499 [Paraburkholderia ultramafica]
MQAITSNHVLRPAISRLRSIAIRRQRVSLGVTAVLLAAHFSFVVSIAFFKSQLAYQLTPGLSIAIAAGVLTVAFALFLTFGFVVWVDRVHDKAVRELRAGDAK